MGIPNKQIGWSQESNLLWQISNQLDQLIKVTASLTTTTTTSTTVAPTTTTTTTASLTTTSTTTSGLFSGTITWSFFDACTDIGGTVTGVTGNGTTFCNSTEIYSPDFVGLFNDVYFSANGGQSRTTQFNGTSTATFIDGCTACP
jgi:hypothetical protein